MSGPAGGGPVPPDGGRDAAGQEPGWDTPARDVVVVGAGPVGLCLALGLARAGRSVLVLEKEPATSEHSRAPAIWPRTQEVLHDLGVLPPFLEEGLVLRALEIQDADRGRPLLRLPLGELAGETPFPHLLILPQSRTERLLHEALEAEPTARVCFSAEVTGVEQEGRGARVTYVRGTPPGTRDAAPPETVETSFVAGCDGASSTLREQIGADFEGTTYPLRVALADVAPAGDPDLPFPRFTTRDALAIAIRIDDRLWRLILPFAEEEGTSLDERVARAVRSTLGPGGYETAWKSVFRIHRRVASRWVSGRVVLAGDAAHLNSPVGGQGMNAGIQDTEVLVDSLLEALERDDPAPLHEYARRRRAAVAGTVNPFTGGLTRLLLFAGGRFVKPIFRAAAVVLRVGPVRRALLRRLAMLR